ncbi:ras family member 12 [Brachionus plicatilis]|uniref:small monomeric GTPase n=1 Tax=Brachionus plicatilis TaxID=10195 RepID=A0A3M7QAT2_BRAPC|nr:ras family member 12 [Brachionus plicatilis]
MNSKNKLGQLKSISGSTKEEICISLVGPVGCGKSALIVKYLTRRFIGEYDPFYEGCWTKMENMDNMDLNVQIMDTYDKEKKNLEKFYKWSDLMILVYSIVDAESFVLIQDYLESLADIIKKINEENSAKKFTKLVLLGNKIDMERYRQVNKNDVEDVLKKYGSGSSKRISDSTNTIISDLERVNGSLNIVHVESTSCEEYDLVQNLFHKLIRECKREKEIFQSLNQPDDGLFSRLPKPKVSGKTRAKSPNLKSNIFIPNEYNQNLSTSPPVYSGSYGDPAFSSAQTHSLPSSNSFTSTPNSSSNYTFPNTGKKNPSKFPFLNKILNKS